jgi:hypothetical protein
VAHPASEVIFGAGELENANTVFWKQQKPACFGRFLLLSSSSCPVVRILAQQKVAL